MNSYFVGIRSSCYFSNCSISSNLVSYGFNRLLSPLWDCLSLFIGNFSILRINDF